MNCPKCGSQMEEASSLGGNTLLKKGDFVGDKVVPFFCKNCGYVELFVEKFLKSL